MLRTVILAAIAAVCLSLPAEARQRHMAHHRYAPECNVSMPCEGVSGVRKFRTAQATDLTHGFVLLRENPAIDPREARRRARGQALYDAMPFGVPTRSAAEGARFIRGTAKPAAQARAAGLVPPLAAKAAEIVAACGSQIISAVRHTYIAGTRRISLHASGEAVDLRGNPSCIYAHLKGWPGGYSTDYGRARHVHVSYSSGGREWGVRFAHGGGRRAKHRRYATAR
jgi:hypothetical protein